MHCIIFGGGGFLGTHVSRALIQAGHRVTVFEKNPPSAENPNIDWIQGDFTDGEQVAQALAGMDVVFHLISTTTPQTSNQDPVRDVNQNIAASVRLLEEMKKAGVGRLVYFSSGGTVYGKPQALPISEEHPNDPICSYGIHKLAVEKYLYMFRHLYGLDYRILRVANPYGPGQSAIGGQGVIAAFLDKIQQGVPLEIWGDGSVIRDYIFVSDVAQAALAVLDYQGEHRIFNVGSGKGHSLVDIVHGLQALMGKPVKVEFLPSRPADVPVNVLDISLAVRELNWKPSWSFREGLAATLRQR